MNRQALIKTKLKASRKCPCGCGRALYPYKGLMVLVCQATWRRAASEDRKVLMLPGHTLQERRAAARNVIGVAFAIKRRREIGAPVANSEDPR